MLKITKGTIQDPETGLFVQVKRWEFLWFAISCRSLKKPLGGNEIKYTIGFAGEDL